MMKNRLLGQLIDVPACTIPCGLAWLGQAFFNFSASPDYRTRIWPTNASLYPSTGIPALQNIDYILNKPGCDGVKLKVLLVGFQFIERAVVYWQTSCWKSGCILATVFLLKEQLYTCICFAERAVVYLQTDFGLGALTSCQPVCVNIVRPPPTNCVLSVWGLSTKREVVRHVTVCLKRL